MDHLTYFPLKIPLTSFGSVDTAQEWPILQTAFYYGIGAKVITDTGASGSVTVVNNEVNCATGTTANAFATVKSKRFLIYKPGQGATAKFTARFTTGIASSLQQAGLLTAVDGAGFGYNGTAFGTYHKYNGEHEQRNLAITAAATGVESLTIVVNGTSHTFDVTAGTVQHNANEIDIALNANIADWDFQQIDDDVIAAFDEDGPQAGTYSFTNNSAGTCAAAWTQINAGVTATTDWTAQAAWNEDPAPFAIDPTQGNVYKTAYQYHGIIGYYIVDPDSGEFVIVHRVKWPNNNTATNFRNPNLQIAWHALSTGSTTNLTVYGSSGAAFIQGYNIITEQPRADQNAVTGISTTLTNILGIQNRQIFGGKDNHAEIILTRLSISTDSTKGVEVVLYKDPVVATASDNWQYVDQTNSIALVNTAGTTYSSGGQFVAGIEIGAAGELDLERLGVIVLPGERLSIFAKVSAAPASQINATLNWKEDI